MRIWGLGLTGREGTGGRGRMGGWGRGNEKGNGGPWLGVLSQYLLSGGGEGGIREVPTSLKDGETWRGPWYLLPHCRCKKK